MGRSFSTADESSAQLRDKGIQNLTEKFFEAKELMEDAHDSFETVYFSEDYEDAQEAVEEVVEDYEALLKTLSEEDARVVKTKIALRIEELKSEFKDLKDRAEE